MKNLLKFITTYQQTMNSCMIYFTLIWNIYMHSHKNLMGTFTPEIGINLYTLQSN